MESAAAKCELESAPDGSAVIVFSGEWALAKAHPSLQSILSGLDRSKSVEKKIAVRTDALNAWDSSLIAILYGLSRKCTVEKITLDYSRLPDGLRGIMDLALAVPPRDAAPIPPRESFLSSIGVATLKVSKSTTAVVPFIGEAALSLGRLIAGRARVRKSDFFEIVQQTGPDALPIVTLISVLVGLILAYIGAIQLRQFGAQIFVANLVGIAMAREMGGIMVGIILAGRTGAAFAAQLGTMEVNEEIDALKTLGVSPMEYLVMPRMLALVVMIPLLCMYAVLAGILGGVIVAVGVLGISLPLYWEQTAGAITLTDIGVGLGKSVVFGALVALCGCYHGMQSGRSASAVGQATTAAVVSGIVCVVVADAVFAVLCDVVGI